MLESLTEVFKFNKLAVTGAGGSAPVNWLSLKQERIALNNFKLV